MKRLCIFAALLFSCSAALTAVTAESTFLGLTLGGEFTVPSCGTGRIDDRSSSCSSKSSTVTHPSGVKVLVSKVRYPQRIVPAWLTLNSVRVVTMEDANKIELISIATDIPTQFMSEKSIDNIYRQLVQKLGPETTRVSTPYFGKDYYFRAIWDKPFGKVFFHSVSKVEGDTESLPSIIIMSNKYLALAKEDQKVRDTKKAKAESEKLKF